MPQSTHSVIMVPPDNFAFNPQTGLDNEFQQNTNLTPEQLKDEVMAEFTMMVNILRDNFVEVLVLNKKAQTPPLPDAVFPNNWFSTHANGQVWLYPMKAANRQAEVRASELTDLLKRHHYRVDDVAPLENPRGQKLEGTGAIIFDHTNNNAYAAISERCEKKLFESFCHKQQLTPISFETQSSSGKPFYHTNVMMSIGESFALVCLAAINNSEQRVKILTSLEKSHKQLIEISLEQAEKNFCANILQLRNSRGEPLIVMSDSAYHGFSKEQKMQLKKYGKLVPCPIETIEKVGGGSARCMLAENFLPKE